MDHLNHHYNNSSKDTYTASWATAKVGDLFVFEYGKALIKSNRTEMGQYPVFGSNGVVGYHDEYLVEGPALIIGRKGTAGEVCLSEKNFWPIDTTYFVRVPDEINFKFAYYLLKSLNLAKLERSTAIPGLNRNDAYELDIQIPPQNEQHRIVAKIEELFSELDKGVESLKVAREQLKVYRQVLLKHAFEGKLTEQWRKAHADQLETTDQLLERIKKEREQRYQQQLTDWEAAGKSGGKPKAQKDMPPITAKELAELPELPMGWGWFQLADMSDISGGLTKNQKRNNLAIKRPFLRVANVYANKLELDDMHYIGITESEIERVVLVQGDILIVEGNGSVDQIGRVARWNGAIDGCIHQNHLIKARPLNLVRSEFVLYFLMSELGRKYIVRVASSTSGLHTLSISKIESLFVPLCALEEQDILLNELSANLSLADQLDQTITTSLQQSEALRQSILKKAFSGQLVPQDLNDEPVSILLEGIRAEREQQKLKSTKSPPRRSVEKRSVEPKSESVQQLKSLHQPDVPIVPSRQLSKEEIDAQKSANRWDESELENQSDNQLSLPLT